MKLLTGFTRSMRPVISRNMHGIRFNSVATSNIMKLAKKGSLTAQIYPIDKDQITEQDVDEWITALQRLKNGNLPNDSTEMYLSQLTETEEHLKEQFTPDEEQLAEQERFSTTKLPLQTLPVVDNLVNLIMRDGKKSQARKIVSRALYIVYLKLRKDPVLVLQETLEQLAPLMATKSEKTGTAKNRIVPYPLKERQRLRYAILWILEGAAKKQSRDYSVRLAEEIVSAYEGKSSGYEKKAQMHKAAITQRAYVKL